MNDCIINLSCTNQRKAEITTSFGKVGIDFNGSPEVLRCRRHLVRLSESDPEFIVSFGRLRIDFQRLFKHGNGLFYFPILQKIESNVNVGGPIVWIFSPGCHSKA